MEKWIGPSIEPLGIPQEIGAEVEEELPVETISTFPSTCFYVHFKFVHITSGNAEN